MRSIVFMTLGVAACGGGDTSLEGEVVARDAQAAVAATAKTNFGDPLPGLSADELDRFTVGQEAFASEEDAEDGLGPVFNGTSCGFCHGIPAMGGGSGLIETRFGRADAAGFDPLAAQGGSLIQTTGLEDEVAEGCPVKSLPGEAVPPEANVQAGRRATPIFGLGLVDAVPDAVFVAIARLQALGGRDGVHGTVARVLDLATGKMRVGKFGWKNQNPTLFQFSADAYLNEMGITTEVFPEDVCPQGNCALNACDLVEGVEDEDDDVTAFNDFMTFLAPPPDAVHSRDGNQGGATFRSLGCDTCHVATLVTGRNAVAALDRVVFHPYSDFLLHDMGALGDGIAQGAAGARQMRTAPLWGVSRQPSFLHDGRASTLEQAILAHDGEARSARNRFARLDARSKARVLTFIGEL